MSAFTATVVAAAMSGSDRLEGSQGNGTNGAAPPTLPAIPIHEGQQAWSAPLARTAPKLDGWLGDWPAAAIAISAIVAGGAQRNGPADASAEAHVLWTPDDLGIAVHVMDDNFLAPSEGPKLGDGDSIELQLDTDLIGDWTDGAYSPDDWRIGLSPGDLSGRASEAYVFWPEPARVLDGVRLASRRVGDGYTIEALIPWTSLGMKSRSLLPLGLALSVMDRDRAGAVPETIVSSSPNRRASDPRTFGTLVLAGDDGAGVIESGRPHSVGP